MIKGITSLKMVETLICSITVYNAVRLFWLGQSNSTHTYAQIDKLKNRIE